MYMYLVFPNLNMRYNNQLLKLEGCLCLGSNHHILWISTTESELCVVMLLKLYLFFITGDWLCLKNLHLVTAWLPSLEKELNSLQPHNNFRLWLTAEVHPKFPTILLQSSLKITYEVSALPHTPNCLLFITV